MKNLNDYEIATYMDSVTDPYLIQQYKVLNGIKATKVYYDHLLSHQYGFLSRLIAQDSGK
ncbi:hypothetical protein E2L92_21945 [Salmonella enterica subsp. enterica serovar Ibadan]|nr:hypothetical protein [Salmonella enterica subsp. enterica serovar Ibadan]ECF3282115.1 hypothetical protein [Salmonella enterica subsp. enterica serovar Ibadan]